MLLSIGASTVDVAERALVVGVLPPGSGDAVVRAAERAAGDGADVVEVPDPELRRDVGVPMAVRTSDPARARTAVAEGAVVIRPTPVAGDTRAVVAALREAAAHLVTAGVDPRRSAVEPVPPTGAELVLPRAPGLACVGVPVVVSVVRAGATSPDPGSVAGPLSVAVVRGCGLVRVAAIDVRSARRVVDVIAAVRRGHG